MIGVFWYFFSNWWTFPFYIVAQCCRHAFPHLHAHRLSHPQNGWVSSSCLSKTCAAWAKAGNNWKYISDTDLDVRWYFMIFVNCSQCRKARQNKRGLWRQRTLGRMSQNGIGHEWFLGLPDMNSTFETTWTFKNLNLMSSNFFPVSLWQTVAVFHICRSLLSGIRCAITITSAHCAP